MITPFKLLHSMVFGAAVATGLLTTPPPAPGRIEGFVRDSAGAPIANAQVFVITTAFSALTDARGHYLITGVPAGRVDLRAAFVGYHPAVARAILVRSGLTARHDFTLMHSVTMVEDLSVNGTMPLVPRDQLAQGGALDIRGRRDEGVTYVDGVPVRTGDRGNGTPSAAPGKVGVTSNGRQEATVTAGAAAEFGHAQSGVIAVSPNGAAQTCCYQPTTPTPATNWNTEEYSHIRENGFRPVSAAPLSTFSIDVDKASYANVRRFLQQGSLPPADAVRIEEMINYFSYDLPEPRGADPFSITTEVGAAPWAQDHRLVRIGIQGKRLRGERMPASNLVFLIDVSGSMEEENKLPLVKRSLRLLVDQLRDEDKVSIVVYAGNAGLVLPCTPGTQKTRILNAIDDLEAGGSTAGGAGIRLAYQIARQNMVRDGNNRVILATDGDFNVGASSEGELATLIEQERRDGIFLTVLGFGTGNYADARMESLADKGNGNYFYVDNITEGRKVFVDELQGTLFTIAKDVKIQVEFNPAEVAAYRLVGYEDRALRDEDFNNDAIDAGELGAGASVTALYELIPVGSADAGRTPGVDPLRYQASPRTGTGARGELLTVKLRYQRPEGSESRLLEAPVRDVARGHEDVSNDFGFAAAVAEFGMLLRNSEFKGTSSASHVLAAARASRGADEDGYRTEFIRLVRTWASLARTGVEDVGVVE